MEHCGFVVKVNKLRKHENADRLQVANFFGNDVCVGLDVKLDDIGIYFPTDLQLSEEYCAANNLVRKKDANGNNIGGYMDPEKRNVKTIRLRGEKSDGLYMELNSLSTFGDISELSIGDHIDVFNGHIICNKYIPRSNKTLGSVKKGNKVRKHKVPVAPLFAEHADTEQLAYHLMDFCPGDEIEITLKMHGTSQRTGYLPVLKKMKRSLLDRICGRPGTPVYDWGYVSGTRRTVLEDFEGGFYGSNEFREIHSKFFEGKLHKGEEVFYEVVGFADSETPIMGDANNKKVNDNDFILKYGNITRFSYGCEPGESDFYVYRMTLTNEDGYTVEYPPAYVRYRCEQMGCKAVPLFCAGHIPYDVSCGEWVKEIAEQFYDGPDPIGKTHVREGVVVRVVNRPSFTAYKHKNFYFKVLEGLIKESAEAPDMEEAEELGDQLA